MARRPSATLVGAFILAGALLVVAGIAFWGPIRILGHRYRYVCYFPGSVNGLNVGAPVRFRGVPVGTVAGMKVRFQQPANDFRIAVFIELSGRRVQALGAMDEPTTEVMGNLVRQGLRARLDTESFVTGQLYVSLDFFPNSAIRLVRGGYPEIPTLPSEFEEFSQSVSTLLTKLDETDVAGAVRSLSRTADAVTRLLESPGMARTLAALPEAVASFQKLTRDVDQDAEHIEQDLDATLAARGPIVADVRRALSDVQRAAAAVRELAEFIRRNPNALIVGKKKP